jgi:RNA polymerase sigma factor (TIGR02999 family)
MTLPPSPDITQLLLAWSNGDQTALNQLMPLVYQELHRLARHYMRREQVGHTLQTTAVIHEAYLRLVDQRKVRWQNRSHFYAICAQAMRRILVDHAKGQRRAKRGGGAAQVSLEEVANLAQDRATDLVAVDELLQQLQVFDSRKSQVVELRFFGGLSVDETAEVLKIAPITVMREWKLAKAWLYRELNRKEGNQGSALVAD